MSTNKDDVMEFAVDLSNGHDFTVVSYYLKDAEMLEYALEKQMPRPPVGLNSECWSCHHHLGGFEERPNYCQECGQKIDLEVVE